MNDQQICIYQKAISFKVHRGKRTVFRKHENRSQTKSIKIHVENIGFRSYLLVLLENNQVTRITY